jgi:hypothetical protein
MSKPLHPSKASPADRYRSLDRALAAKYVQLVLAHRRRVAAAQSGISLPEAMRPRCVLTSLTRNVFPDCSRQRGNM